MHSSELQAGAFESSPPQQFTRPPDGPQNYEQARLRAQIEAWAGSTRHFGTTAEEFRAAPDTMAQAGSVRGLGNLPLAVVSAGEQSPGWLALQNELATLSTNSNHQVVGGATHTSLVDDAAHARATTAAIVDVVDAARNHRPLVR